MLNGKKKTNKNDELRPRSSTTFAPGLGTDRWWRSGPVQRGPSNSFRFSLAGRICRKTTPRSPPLDGIQHDRGRKKGTGATGDKRLNRTGGRTPGRRRLNKGAIHVIGHTTKRIRDDPPTPRPPYVARGRHHRSKTPRRDPAGLRQALTSPASSSAPSPPNDESRQPLHPGIVNRARNDQRPKTTEHRSYRYRWLMWPVCLVAGSRGSLKTWGGVAPADVADVCWWRVGARVTD